MLPLGEEGAGRGEAGKRIQLPARNAALVGTGLGWVSLCLSPLRRPAGPVWDAQMQQAAWRRSAPDLGAMEGKGFFWVEAA